jgi:hypothetical protein
MVRFGWSSERREQFLSALIVSWAQNRERAHGGWRRTSPSRAAIVKDPLPKPSTPRPQGAIVTLPCPSTVRDPNVERPLQATTDGSVLCPQMCCVSPHASSLRIVTVLCCIPACLHALHLPHTNPTPAGSHHFLRLAPFLAIDANVASHRQDAKRSMPANPGLAPPLLLFPPGSPYYRPRDPLTSKSQSLRNSPTRQY